jgi:hypothetical protein
MASGHVNRIKRPDTWLHRPMLQNVKKVLANPEPSTHGTKRTSQSRQLMSALWGRADITWKRPCFRFDPTRTSGLVGASGLARAGSRARMEPLPGYLDKF